ncbi:hypothetical protein ACNKHO_10245 [Shigella flexneri]
MALQFLRNSDIAAKGILPTCQEPYRHHHGQKGQRVWTGGGDEPALARGVLQPLSDDLRYSQNAPLDTTRRSIPAPTYRAIDLYSVDADGYSSCVSPKVAAANKPISPRKPKR